MSGASTAEAVNGNASPGEGLANEESKVVNLVWDKDSKPKPEKQVRKPATKSGAFKVNSLGVFYGEDKDRVRICSPLRVLALTRDEGSNDWGRLLEFEDPDGQIRRWTMPASMLKGDGSDYRGILLSQGFDIAGKSSHEKLSEYIRSQNPTERVTCVNKTGWYQGSFVLPDRTIGSGANEITFHQASYAAPIHLKQRGSVEEWKELIGRYCTGQHRLIYMISAAISAPLLEIIGADSSGVHYVGGSSVGKSTGIKLATSFFASPDYNLTWNSTSNGLEADAASRCDLPLVLDEIGQADGSTVGAAIYTLCNGKGRGRADRNGDGRKAKALRNRILSSGEVEVGSHIESAGKTSRAGHTVRLVNIQANAGKGLGILNFVPEGFSSASNFIDYLSAQSKEVYGAPGLAFIERIASDRTELASRINTGMEAWIKLHLPIGSTEQVSRVASQFAFTAVSGEIATRYGFTDWDSGESFEAAADAFQSWLTQRGTGEPEEEGQAVQKIKSFIEANQFGRIVAWLRDDADPRIVHNCVGYKDLDSNRFLLTAGGFKEAINGLNITAVCDVLARKGFVSKRRGR